MSAWRGRFVRVSVILVLVATALVGRTSRAEALSSPDGYFIDKLYQDFLQRNADQDEEAAAIAYLSTHTRTQLAEWLMLQDEFVYQWIWGTYQQYLATVPTDSEFLLAVADFQSTSNYLNTEATVLSSAAYFANAGGTNSGYVSAVYQSVLYRAADPSGLSYYTSQLDSGAKTRADVARLLIRSTEGSTRRVNGVAGATTCAWTAFDDFDSLKSGSYCIVLDRLADPSGLSYWVGQLSGSAQLPLLWASNAGSTEYYNHAQP